MPLYLGGDISFRGWSNRCSCKKSWALTRSRLKLRLGCRSISPLCGGRIAEQPIAPFPRTGLPGDLLYYLAPTLFRDCGKYHPQPACGTFRHRRAERNKDVAAPRFPQPSGEFHSVATDGFARPGRFFGLAEDGPASRDEGASRSQRRSSTTRNLLYLTPLFDPRKGVPVSKACLLR